MNSYFDQKWGKKLKTFTQILSLYLSTKNSNFDQKWGKKLQKFMQILSLYKEFLFWQKVRQKKSRNSRKLKQSINECSHDFQIW